MAMINSVLGPLDTENLGFTLAHEHLMVSAAGIPRDYPDLLDKNYLDEIVNKLNKAKAGGINTVVDATTIDLGRDVETMAEASRRTGVNIIACTGWWMEKPRFVNGISPDQFADVFTREIAEGIAGTKIKAGILKAASDFSGVLPFEEVILRGVARAHHKTGAPIMLHSYSPGQVGRQQLAILKQEGVDLRRVKMDHSNDTTDLEYLTWLLDQGCYLGLDRYPGQITSPLARTKTLKALIDAGYQDRLCPSHDFSLAQVLTLGEPMMSQAARDRYNPDGYLYITNVVIPQLREMGVPEDILNNLCISGPKNFLGGII
jgi:phosphotriesterase-related protein